MPELARRGKMTVEKLVADFMKNEGSVKEWPDFGAVHSLEKALAGYAFLRARQVFQRDISGSTPWAQSPKKARKSSAPRAA